MNRSRTRYWSYIPLILLSIFYLIPIYVMLVTGFKAGDEISVKTMWDLPKTLGLENYLKAYKLLSPNLLNSLKVVVPAAILSSILGSLNGYVLANGSSGERILSSPLSCSECSSPTNPFSSRSYSS